jgi:hypothetical protein
MSSLITYRLRNGANVLGKLYKGRVEPTTYTNYTQAAKRASTVGGEVVRFTRVFYVVIPSTQEAV